MTYCMYSSPIDFILSFGLISGNNKNIIFLGEIKDSNVVRRIKQDIWLGLITD